MLSLKKYIAAGLLIFAAQAQADVFFGIHYMDTLQEVKEKYPHADYEELKPAWLKTNEKYLFVSGPGLLYSFAVLFKKLPVDTSVGQGGDFAVHSIRIPYAGQVKFSEFKKKYGKPLKCILDEDFKRLCFYPKNGFSVALSDDGASVDLLISFFTEEERLRMNLDRTAKDLAKVIENPPPQFWSKPSRNFPPPIEAPAAAPAPPDPLDAYATSPAKN